MLITLTKTINTNIKHASQVLLCHEQLNRFFNAEFQIIKTQNHGELIGGAGTIRQVCTRGKTFKEEILKASQSHIRYAITGPGPLINHQGDIYLVNNTEKDTDNCQIKYDIVGNSANWIPEFLLKIIIKRDINQALNKLKRHFHES